MGEMISFLLFLPLLSFLSHWVFTPRSVLPITLPPPANTRQRLVLLGGLQNWKRRGGGEKKQTGVQVCDV